jgi:hypothetical protein
MWFRPGVTIVAALFLGSCSTDGSRVETPRPSELMIWPGAHDIREAGGADGRYDIGYTIEAPFPPTAIQSRIETTLAEDGWTPLTVDWLNPGRAAGHAREWTSLVDGTKTPNTQIDVWAGQWRDASGNLVVYGLQYKSALAMPGTSVRGPDNAGLVVIASFFPAKVVAAMRSGLGIEAPLR